MPGIGAKKVQESSRTNLELPGTYIAGSVALEGAVINLEVAILNINSSTIGGSVALEGAAMDLYIGTIGKNSTALEVACPPPGIRVKFEIVLLAEYARMELKISANESGGADLPSPI
jgi:hypothetical protein